MPYRDMTDAELEAAFIETTTALVARTLELVGSAARLGAIVAGTRPPDIALCIVRQRVTAAVDSALDAIDDEVSSPRYRAIVADAPAAFAALRARPRARRVASVAPSPQQ